MKTSTRNSDTAIHLAAQRQLRVCEWAARSSLQELNVDRHLLDITPAAWRVSVCIVATTKQPYACSTMYPPVWLTSMEVKAGMAAPSG